MSPYELLVIDAKVLGELRDRSEGGAPWASLPPQAWDFLEAGLQAGLAWSLPQQLHTRWVTPKSKAATARQQAALKALLFTKPVFPSGIGLYASHYVGGESGHGWMGEGESTYNATTDTVPAQDAILARLMGVFWPEVPPLVWAQVRDLLVHREQTSQPEMYGGTSDYAVDTLDFGKAFRCLQHADKLQPQLPVIEWAQVIDPPAPVVAPPVVAGRRPKR